MHGKRRENFYFNFEDSSVGGGGVFSNKTVAMRLRGIETVKRVSVVFDIIQLDVATMLIRSI